MHQQHSAANKPQNPEMSLSRPTTPPSPLNPVNWVTRLFGPHEHDIRENLDHIGLCATVLTAAIYFTSIAFPAWPLFSVNAIYWLYDVSVLYFLSLLMRYDLNGSYNFSLLYRVACLVAQFMLLKPLVALITETYICSGLSSADQALFTTCKLAADNNYADPSSELACQQIYSLNVDNLATGQCPFLIGPPAYATFIIVSQFFLIFLYSLKNILCFYLGGIYSHILFKAAEMAAAKKN